MKRVGFICVLVAGCTGPDTRVAQIGGAPPADGETLKVVHFRGPLDS